MTSVPPLIADSLPLPPLIAGSIPVPPLTAGSIPVKSRVETDRKTLIDKYSFFEKKGSKVKSKPALPTMVEFALHKKSMLGEVAEEEV